MIEIYFMNIFTEQKEWLVSFNNRNIEWHTYSDYSIVSSKGYNLVVGDGWEGLS